MEMLQQIFMTALAAFVFVILIAKLASGVNNGDGDGGNRKGHGFSKVVAEELKLKTEKSGKSKSKSRKKVRFAVDDDEFIVNKIVAGLSDSKQVVVEKNCEEELINLNEVAAKSPEQGFGHGVVPVSPLVDSLVFNDDLGDEKSDYHQIKEGKIELGDLRSSEGTVIRDLHEENVDDDEEYKKRMKLFCDDGIDEDAKENEGLISDEDDSSSDDWEGVERSELEKVFAMAADHVNVNDHLQSLETDVQMELYGLHKVAMEGPCHEAQPMALKVSARAKWNVWHKLGNMNPDVAMEQYIRLVSEKVPGFSQGFYSAGLDLSSSDTNTYEKEREREIESCSNGGDLVGVLDSANEDKQ